MSGERILIVDDDADIRDLLELKLGLHGYEVVPASDGLAGLAAFDVASIDLALIDWMMPKMDGLELCQAIRRSTTARVPLVLLTAKAQEDDVERGFAAGADDYIVKPFSPRELVSRIGALLARSQ